MSVQKPDPLIDREAYIDWVLSLNLPEFLETAMLSVIFGRQSLAERTYAADPTMRAQLTPSGQEALNEVGLYENALLPVLFAAPARIAQGEWGDLFDRGSGVTTTPIPNPFPFGPDNLVNSKIFVDPRSMQDPGYSRQLLRHESTHVLQPSRAILRDMYSELEPGQQSLFREAYGDAMGFALHPGSETYATAFTTGTWQNMPLPIQEAARNTGYFTEAAFQGPSYYRNSHPTPMPLPRRLPPETLFKRRRVI